MPYKRFENMPGFLRSVAISMLSITHTCIGDFLKKLVSFETAKSKTFPLA